jgi:hypothetical protein
MTGIRDALDDMAAVGALETNRKSMILDAFAALDSGDRPESLVLAARAVIGALAYDADAASKVWDRMHAEDLRQHQAAMSLRAAPESQEMTDGAVGASRAAERGIHE